MTQKRRGDVSNKKHQGVMGGYERADIYESVVLMMMDDRLVRLLLMSTI